MSIFLHMWRSCRLLEEGLANKVNASKGFGYFDSVPTEADMSINVSKLSANALLTLGEPDKCGELWYQQRNLIGWTKWKSSYGIIAKDNLIMFNNKNSREPKFSFRTSCFEHAKVNDPIDGENFCFIVRFEKGDQRPLIFACDTDTTRISWVESINEAIKKVKKDSCDSAYWSGGSMPESRRGSSKQASNGNENNYNEIDDSDVLPAAGTEKLSTEIDQQYHSMPSCSVPDLLDSAYLHVGTSSQPKSTEKGIPFGNTYTGTMENLKLPVAETTGIPNNTDRINEGSEIEEGMYANTMKDFATYSNLDVREADGCVSSQEQVISGTPFFKTSNIGGYGTARKQFLPIIARKPTKPRNTDMTPNIGPSVQPESEQQDSGFLQVDVNSSQTEVKTPFPSSNGAHKPTPSMRNLDLQIPEADTNPEEPGSDESSPVYENTTFGPDFKAKEFKKEEYMCDSMKQGCLKSKPVGTFFVRRGKSDTNYELAIKTEKGVSLFRIFEGNGMFFLIENTVFPSIDRLVRHYSFMILPSSNFKVTLEQGINSKRQQACDIIRVECNLSRAALS